ncbi:MAG: mechanosensitive ion channel family protein [Dehalococcoidia bacterium]|nr:mechanosensitive ion channel family protein [Dehalococcoidia bacterium]
MNPIPLDLPALLAAGTLPGWTGAAGLAVATLLGLLLGRAILLAVTARVAAGAAATSVRAVPHRLLVRTRFLVALAVALFVGSFGLDLSEAARTAVRAGLALVVLLQVAFWGSDLISFWADRYQARAVAQGATSAAATAFALRFMGSLALWVVLVLLALENVGLEVTTLVAGLGIGGIAIALAAQSVLGDFFASLAIVLDRPFVVGDFIVVDSLRGTVERVGIKTTRVRSIDGEQLVFANSDLVRSRIRNFGRLMERRIVARFRLEAATPAELVEAATSIIRDAVTAQPAVRLDRAHFIGITSGAPELEAVYFVQSPAFETHMDIQQAVHLHVLRRFAEAGIGFAGVPSSSDGHSTDSNAASAD